VEREAEIDKMGRDAEIGVVVNATKGRGSQTKFVQMVQILHNVTTRVPIGGATPPPNSAQPAHGLPIGCWDPAD